MEVLDLSPGQVMPLVWRVAQVIAKVTESWEDPFNLSDLAHVYKIHVKASNRCTLHVRRGRSPLVGNVNTNDRGWKTRYVFVDKETLGEGAQWMRTGWRGGVIDVNAIVAGDKSDGKVRAFLRFPLKDRTFPSTGADTSERSGSDSEEDVRFLDEITTMVSDAAHSSKSKALSIPHTEMLERAMKKRKKLTPKIQVKEEEYEVKVPACFLFGEPNAASLWPTTEKCSSLVLRSV
ncbi:uncharacterized protein LOC110705495 [Chenopodium quinoa]|uniref:uncharacterized protein LOC110705495 n=1 Tax=Chenopodium quinoa TaxID=63459 RepID=UPI000B779E23|nr:uncharacterized protein LOC110705495 [Chenopodium quinoa]